MTFRLCRAPLCLNQNARQAHKDERVEDLINLMQRVVGTQLGEWSLGNLRFKFYLRNNFPISFNESLKRNIGDLHLYTFYIVGDQSRSQIGMPIICFE